MNSSAVSPVDAVARYSTFDALRLGRSKQVVVARLIRQWDSRNVLKNEFMGITLLLLDEKDAVIHCFIPANRANHYRPFLRTGSIIKLDRFEVARVGHMYKVTEHHFVVRFTPATSIVEIPTGGPPIRFEKFMVRRNDHLQILANTNLELPDVVGQIRSVQGSDLTNEAETTRIVVRLLIEPAVIVYLSLWDEAASSFRALLKGGDKSHSVMVVTTVNPNIFGGSLYLNSTPATRFFFDTDLAEITEFLSSLGASASQVYPCVDTLAGIDKKELVSIGDLNTFISNSNPQTQEADFLCKARIIDVLQANGWSFVSCTKCNKKLEKTESALFCNKCVSTDVTGVVRFRVELSVDDGKDGATFVVFDREMTKVTKQEADVLALAEDPNGGEEELPGCLEELIGKEFVFQIRVTPFNFTPNHRTFTVSTMTEYTSIEPHTEETGENSLASTGVVGVGSGSSSGASASGSKGGEGDTGNLSGTGGTGDTRKRPRE